MSKTREESWKMTPLALATAVLVERTEAVRARRLGITVATWNRKTRIFQMIANLFYLAGDICIVHYTDIQLGIIRQDWRSWHRIHIQMEDTCIGRYTRSQQDRAHQGWRSWHHIHTQDWDIYISHRFSPPDRGCQGPQPWDHSRRPARCILGGNEVSKQNIKLMRIILPAFLTFLVGRTLGVSILCCWVTGAALLQTPESAWFTHCWTVSMCQFIIS